MTAPASRIGHWEWVLRKRRAQLANIVGRPFTYDHPVVGRFLYHPDDDLSRHLLLYDFEGPELRFAMRRAATGGVVVDVGANIGVFTVACARAAGAGGRVIALEPSPAAFRKLLVTCRRLEVGNVELLQAAAAATSGRARFVADGVHALRHHLADRRDDAGPAIEVETRRLDDVCGDRASAVTLLKLDVEGHEVAALHGAARILASGRTHLIVEVNPSALAAAGSSAAELGSLLSRTHVCVAVVGEGGRVDPGRSDVVVEPPAEMVNTLWEPRAA